MKIAIIAGEASGDILGAELMAGFEASYHGVGGSEMARHGLKSVFPMDELSVMGIGEVLPKLPLLLRRIGEISDMIIAGDFDAVITIDSPDFCHRVARRVKKARPDLPIIHYVAPSVWAWREGRASKMAHHVNHVLCLLPFEPPYMTKAGMTAEFVGHPVARRPDPSAREISQMQDKFGQFIALFPGSRSGEMRRHLPAYAQMISALPKHQNIVIPLHAQHVNYVRSQLGAFENVHILSSEIEDFEQQKNAVMHACHCAVATSGTVSFELAWAGAPTIVGYNTSWFTKVIYKRMIKVKYASLANILCDAPIIPELLFENFTPSNLTQTLQALLADPKAREHQRLAFETMRARMRPERDAAAAVRQYLGQE